jgi:hypothetical protein
VDVSGLAMFKQLRFWALFAAFTIGNGAALLINNNVVRVIPPWSQRVRERERLEGGG